MARTQQDSNEQSGLRELKKRRTRDAIVRVALDLFGEHGYRGTTLVEIAAAAEIAPSTLHAYFPNKGDILFGHITEIVTSAKQRLLDHPDGTAMDAFEQWVSIDLPTLAESDDWAFQRRRAIIDIDDELLAEETLRINALDDVFAQAYAHDLGETPDDLRSRLMAAITLAGVRTAWHWSYRQQPKRQFDPKIPYALDRAYVAKILAAAETAIEQLPPPTQPR